MHKLSPERRGRVLVVDDQPINIRMLHAVLAEEFEVFAATSGEQALEFCRDSKPDLILLDVVMPGMDGLTVCRRLKQDQETRAIPVIFVTAGILAEEENACWSAGAADFVSKPVNPLTLRNRVLAHLQFKLHMDALQAMAFADGLTGVANRRLFDDTAKAECRRCARSGKPLAMLMIDVDFFKRYNDHYGHQAGDECLKRVALTLKDNLKRPHDLVARYGGEEFACMLPDTDEAGAMTVAEQLRLAIAALAIAHADSLIAPHVTISVGVAVLRPQPDDDCGALLRQADQALYQAKHEGRDRCRLAQ
ncbi:diguanylate cyclase [Rugamonas apoptosis]|uniref:diguanylate cyclase n=1 Tax=Rugamonas apoptosis TaxID=2758570 RepID=A0A7W2FA48_9BURK|nr:diguanylate cyclase [Rugamonas apoptosis]MBA5687905.1 diguanylate cyclase [Rugamonas apoptosis]